MEVENLHIVYGLELLPLRVSNFEIPCYILNNKQQVFSIKGIQKIFHYDGKSDFWLANILHNINSFPEQIFNAYESPIIAYVSANGSSEIIRVIDADVFVTTCKIISETENHDSKADLAKLHKRATAFYKAIENENLHDLIDEASGYLFTKVSVKTRVSQYLQKTIQDDAYNWAQTIPEYFYETLFDSYELDWKKALNNPQAVGKLFIELVFSRLPNELMFELQTKQPKRVYARKGKLPQEATHPKLKNYIDNVMALLETSGNNQYIFLQLLNRACPTNTGYEAIIPVEDLNKPANSIFSASMKKIL